jgi:hypothetical protein
MIDKDQVLRVVQQKGPVIPRDIIKELGGDTFLIGALLSQLRDDKQIKISSAKVGGSPMYYVNGQHEKLQTLYNYLNSTEKKAYDILKQRKIIRDYNCEPSLRVALRGIKDFAKALEVNINGQKEIFWKWYLIQNNEAESIIRTIVLGNKQKDREIPKTPIETEKKEEIIEQQVPEKKIEEKQISNIQKDDNKEIKEEQTHLSQTENIEDHELLQRIHTDFKNKKIKIIETEIIRKNSDIEMIIKIPSSAGDLKYYCKIRDKKKSNDKDISSAFVEGQMKKLPILYVTTGELTKKAKEKLERDFSTVSILYL